MQTHGMMGKCVRAVLPGRETALCLMAHGRTPGQEGLSVLTHGMMGKCVRAVLLALWEAPSWVTWVPSAHQDLLSIPATSARRKPAPKRTSA